jgi:hypothetical protein
MKIEKVVHAPGKSNNGNENWLIFDYIIKSRFLFLRFALAKELWYQTLQKNGAKLFKVFGIDVEQDKEDPTLKLYSFVFLGFLVSVARI